LQSCATSPTQCISKYASPPRSFSGEKERTFREKTTKRGGRAHWTGERREKKTKKPEERTNKAGFFSEAEKNHREQREHKQRRQKTKELGMLTEDRRKQKKGNKQRERPEQEDTTRGDEQHKGDLETQTEANEQKQTRK